MSIKRLLAVHLEAINGRENDNFIIQALTSQPFAVWRESDRRHTVHGWISNILHINWNIPLPNAHALVI